MSLKVSVEEPEPKFTRVKDRIPILQHPPKKPPNAQAPVAGNLEEAEAGWLKGSYFE
jgi:hypothetical protein